MAKSPVAAVLAVLLCLALGAACAPSARLAVAPAVLSAEGELNAEASAGVSDPKLKKLLHDHWEYTMVRWPTWATALGDGAGRRRGATARRGAGGSGGGGGCGDDIGTAWAVRPLSSS